MHAPTVGARLPAKNGRSTLFVTDTPTLAPLYQIQPTHLGGSNIFRGQERSYTWQRSLGA